MRITCDTNVMVSGLLWPGGSPAKLLALVEAHRHQLFLSEALLYEFADVVSRPKFRAILAQAAFSPHDLVRWVVGNATLVIPKPLERTVVEADPADDAVLACARSAAVDFIVSGDRHLLDLGEFKGMPIKTARDVLRGTPA